MTLMGRSLILVGLAAFSLEVAAKSYRRAVEQEGNVRNKLFPKNKKIELSLPSFGVVLNQSYLDSFAVHTAASYYVSENWGVTLEAMFAINEDKPERYCIENFYNDYEDQVAASCPDPSEDKTVHLFDSNGNAKKGANFGPAYAAVREINTIITGAATWAPIYGKQLAFLTQTLYFDLFFTFGAGVTMSTFYPESSTLRDGRLSRGLVTADLPDNGCPTGTGIPGVCPNDTDSNWSDLIGVNGRPDPEEHVTPTLAFGLGQKIHFLDRWHLRAEVRNYTLVGTHAGIEMFFMMWAGVGLRL